MAVNADVTVVIPTIGRPSLDRLLAGLAEARGPRPAELIIVDDRRCGAPLTPRSDGLPPVSVLTSGGRGPAAARNVGWRRARTAWVAFLDDDVRTDPDWYDRLAADLAGLPPTVAGSQGAVTVPLPTDRRPTDWERGTAGLATSRWITADMAYRRAALAAVGGFDERFLRAFREDADLALRVLGTGSDLTQGSRRITHPVRPASQWVSLRVQAGNADDVLMRRLHGRRWRERVQAPAGRRRQHLVITAAGLAAVGLAVAGRRRAATVAGLGWAAGTADFARIRIRPGPPHPGEIVTMALTSAAIPPVATWHFLRGVSRHRAAAAWHGLPELVLFDRDGTLVEDVPYNGDPELVRPVPTARAALDRLRAEGVRVGVVTNQSGVARGTLTRAAVDAVNARVERLLGPFSTWQVCVHAPDGGCPCRKPAPGMVLSACAALGVDPARCVVVGDIGSDITAATAAGARSILVPTAVTRREEVTAAPVRAPDLSRAADLLLTGAW